MDSREIEPCAWCNTTTNYSDLTAFDCNEDAWEDIPYKFCPNCGRDLGEY